MTGLADPGRLDPEINKHFILVRSDLPVGVMGAQITHAAGESAGIRPPPPNCHAVVLAAKEAELHRLEKVLRKEGIQIAAIYEDDPPFEGMLLAIGVAPCQKEASRWLRHLPLLGGPRQK